MLGVTTKSMSISYSYPPEGYTEPIPTSDEDEDDDEKKDQ